MWILIGHGCGSYPEDRTANSATDEIVGGATPGIAISRPWLSGVQTF
jgi:hypothetical protein